MRKDLHQSHILFQLQFYKMIECRLIVGSLFIPLHCFFEYKKKFRIVNLQETVNHATICGHCVSLWF